MKRSMKISLWVILLSIYLIMLCKSQDPDMYWIIANGREILQHGILRTNPTSIVELPIINQQWLYCVLVAMVDRLGYFGHIGFVALQDCLLISLASYWLNTKIKNRYLATTIAFGLMLCCFYMINIRPQIITMCLLIAHLIVMDKAQYDKRWYWLTIPIIILEANLHGALILYHGILVVPYLRKNRKINWYAFAHAASILPLALINPYGIGMLKYSLDALASPAFDYVSIRELMPASPLAVYSWVVLVSIFLFAVCCYMRKLSFQVCWYTMLITILSMHQIRHTTIIYLPLLVMCAQIFENITMPDFKFMQDKAIKLASGALAVSSCFICIICILMSYSNYDITKKDSVMTSYTLAQQIDDKNAKIFSNFNNGGYLEYVGFTNVMLDARPEIYVEKNVLRDWSSINFGMDAVQDKVYTNDEINALIAQYEFEYIFAVPSTALNRVCASYPEKYQLIGTDTYYNLYEVIQNGEN